MTRAGSFLDFPSEPISSVTSLTYKLDDRHSLQFYSSDGRQNRKLVKYITIGVVIVTG